MNDLHFLTPALLPTHPQLSSCSWNIKYYIFLSCFVLLVTLFLVSSQAQDAQSDLYGG